MGKDGKFLTIPSDYVILKEEDTELSSLADTIRPIKALSEKGLFGREKEYNEIHKCFEEVRSNDTAQLFLISGPSGCGKSAIVESMRSYVTSDECKGFFSVGKFEQKFEDNSTDAPFSALAVAFSEIVEFILNLKNESLVLTWKNEIVQALGDNISTLIGLIPNLSQLTGISLNENSSNASKHFRKRTSSYISDLFQSFLHTLTKKNTPILLFMDDLQWADSDSLSIFRTLATDKTLKHILIVGAYRSNESSTFTLSICDNYQQEIKKSKSIIKNFSLEGIKYLIRGKLRLDESVDIDQLAEMVLKKSDGNAFHAIQYLLLLCEKRLLVHDDENTCWTWKIDQIVEKTDISDSMLEVVRKRIEGLSMEVKFVMTLMAFVGYSFEIDTVVFVITHFSNSSNNVHREIPRMTNVDLITAVERGVQDGFIEKYSAGNYKFSHDGIRQAFYDMIHSREARSEMHYRIGIILSNFLQKNAKKKIFLTVNQLNQGIIERSITDEESLLCAKLNMDAGKCSAAQAAYSIACEYFRKAAELLKDERYWKSEYELMVELNSSLAEMEARTSHSTRSRQISHAVLARANSIDDKLRAMVTLVESYVVQNSNDSIEIGLHFLNMLGIKIPTKPNILHVLANKVQVTTLLRKVTFDDILNLPPVENPRIIAAMDIMEYILFSIVLRDAKFELCAMISLRSIELTLKYGICKLSGMCIVSLAMMYSMRGKYLTASRYGHLAFQIQNKLPTPELQPRVLVALTHFVYGWEQSLENCITITNSGLTIGKEVGCFEFAYLNGISSLFYRFHSGENLNCILSLLKQYVKEMNECQVSFARCVIPYFQVVEKLTEDSVKLIGLEESYVADHKLFSLLKGGKKDVSLLLNIYAKIMAAIIFNHWKSAAEMALLVRKLIARRNGHAGECLCYFYAVLAYVEAYHNNIGNKWKNLRRVKRFYRFVKKMVAIEKAVNFYPQFLLVKAELLSINYGKNGKEQTVSKLIKNFEDSIIAAKDNGLIHFEAIFNERASAVCLRLGEVTQSEIFLSKARQCYKEWGAYAKFEEMKKFHISYLYQDGDNKRDKAIHFNTPNTSN